MLNRIVLFFSCVFIFQTNLFGQSTDYEVFQLRFLYDEIKFEEVILSGQKLLKNPDLNKSKLIEIHNFMALSFFNLGKQDSSRAHFYSVLSINPAFEPDPVKTSPKILSFFQDIKQNFQMDRNDRTAIPYKNYIFVKDIRPQAALRSLAFPGWGQLYKRDDQKGYILGGAFVGSLLTTAVTYTLERNLRHDYLNENSTAKVDNRYRDYNNMSKVRRVFQYTTIGIWVASIADALYSEYTPAILVDDEYVAFALQVRF
ncbi:MAG: hypothetical protein D8M58_12715 [Calditrichaeota bacterium]|nr:MAG: hypothetical protein DWQ03_13500 [Calditrichota bacterium]MBL1206260.1 hypothetical protein [Calditrichota bacterium]NOG46086.1 hypothetical protein [Calditrichota bacterium]